MKASDQLRAVLKAKDVSLYRVAKETGISWSTLYRFGNGENIGSDFIDTLADYCGLTFVAKGLTEAGPSKSAKGKR